MNYRKLGKYGLKVSEISIGGWLTYGGAVDEKHTSQIILRAIEHGINFIDIADIYARGESERVIGKAISEITRSDLVISSKVFWPMSDNINDRGLSRKHIVESVEKSLKRIGTDYLDIYFCHRYDPEVEIEEVVCAMDDLVRQGKVLYWGTSVWDSLQLERAISDCKTMRRYLPAVEQPRYNMIDRHIEVDIMDTCASHGMGLVVWSPLCQGLLTGKYNNGIPADSRGGATEWLGKDLAEANIEKVRKLATLSADLQMTISQLALAWVLRQPAISSAITGATRLEQLDENVAVSGKVLDDETLGRIEAILDNCPNPDKFSIL